METEGSDSVLPNAPPPVSEQTSAAEPPPNGRRASTRVVAVVAIFGVALAGTLGVLGATTNDQLISTRGDVGARQAELDKLTADIDEAEKRLAATKADLDVATGERADREGEVSSLEAELADARACVAAQGSLIDRLGRIADLDTENFNRTAENSAWEKALLARNDAVDDAGDRYYRAYRQAFDGNASAARSTAASAAEAVDRANEQAQTMRAEQKAVDAAARDIGEQLDAAKAQLAVAERQCLEAGDGD